MPASSAHPMSLPRTSAFSDFSNPDSRFDPVVVPSRARDYYRDTDYQNQQGLSSPVLDYGNMTSTSASTSSASHNLPGTPDRDKLLVLDTEQASPHVRTNFRRGYHPPAIKDNPVRQPPPIERQENNAIHKPRTSNTSDRSDEVPFDMKNDTTKPPSQQQQGQSRHHPPNTTWAAREELDPERGRFVITPPKYSNPTRLNTLHHPKAMYGVRRDDDSDDKAVVALGMGAAAASTVTPGPVEDYYSSPHRIIEPNPSPCDDYEEFGLSPGSMGSKGDLDNPEEEDSLFDFELEASSHPRGFPKIASNRKSTHVQHRRAKNKMIEIDDRDDDTASLEEAPYGHKTPSPTNLHDRTAQAWAVRNKVSSLKTNKSKEDAWQKIQGKSKSKQEPKTTSPSDEEKLNKQGVSFGVTDTVHHFQPHIVPDDDDGTLGTFNSFDDRSLNSEYTKTMESEVEDVIKDIFFIGTEYKSRPGRRKLKYRHEVKRKLQLRKMNILEEDEGSAGTDDKTKDTENDDVAGASKYLVNIPNDHKATPSIPKSSQKKTASNVKPRSSLEEAPTPNSPDRSTPPKSEKRTVTEKQVSKAHREEKEADDDPFLAMWGYVEGGMKAMSEALGLEPDPAETTERKASSSSSKKSSSSSKEKAAKSLDARSQSSDKRKCGDQITLILSGDEARTYSPTKTTRKKAEPMEEADQGLGFIDYAQDTMFGPLPSVETGDSGVSIHGDASSVVEAEQILISFSPFFCLPELRRGWFQIAIAIAMPVSVNRRR